MGYFFLKNWYFYGFPFKFHGSTSLPKPNLSTPQWGFEIGSDINAHMNWCSIKNLNLIPCRVEWIHL